MFASSDPVRRSYMSRFIGTAILLCSTLPLFGWQQSAATRPNFSGSWELDLAKSNTALKDTLVWKIDHKLADIAIDEVSATKTLSSTKCTIAKPCEFDDNGKKSSAMTYFLETTLVQIRSAPDNSSVVERHLTIDEHGSMRVEVMGIVPSSKTEVLVFTRQNAAAAVAKPASLNKTAKQ